MPTKVQFNWQNEALKTSFAGDKQVATFLKRFREMLEESADRMDIYGKWRQAYDYAKEKNNKKLYHGLRELNNQILIEHKLRHRY